MTGVTPEIAAKRHHQNPRHGVSHHPDVTTPDALTRIERELSNIRDAVARCRHNSWSPSRVEMNLGGIIDHAARIQALARKARSDIA